MSIVPHLINVKFSIIYEFMIYDFVILIIIKHNDILIDINDEF